MACLLQGPGRQHRRSHAARPFGDMTRVRPPDAAPRATIAVEPEPADVVREAVLSGLRAFNRRHAEAPGFEPLVLSARDGSGKIVGGLVGLTGWKWLHIDLLWVDDAHRGSGVGTNL